MITASSLLYYAIALFTMDVSRDKISLRKYTSRNSRTPRFLLVNSICEGLNVAKTGLLELMYLARQSNRIIVEPRVSRMIKYKSAGTSANRQLSFGYGKCGGGDTSFREFYDLDSVLSTLKVHMITFEEYIEHMEEMQNLAPKTLNFEFNTPIRWNHTVPPSCKAVGAFPSTLSRVNSDDQYYYLFHGVVDEIEVKSPWLLKYWKTLCVPSQNHSMLVPEAIETLKLDSSIDTISVSGYIGRSTFVKTPLWKMLSNITGQWAYGKRLEKKAIQLAKGTENSSRVSFAAYHLRVVKMFQMNLPYSQVCADMLLKVVSKQLQKHNIKSIYIASDLIPEVDIHSANIAPYVHFMTLLGERFNVIPTVDRMDVDRDFLDQILCTKADMFMFTSGISLDQTNNCTRWSSHYTDWILANRPQDSGQVQSKPPKLVGKSVNLSPFL